MADSRPVELIAVAADGSETHFDAMPLAPGVHLRWSFWSEMGWPPEGFEIRRRGYLPGFEFTPPRPEKDWTRLATLTLPQEDDVEGPVLRRARTVTSGAATAAYAAELRSLVPLIEGVKAGTPTPPLIWAHRGTTRIGVPALDALLLAALDPYIARGLGLAYVDGQVAPRTPVDYQVLGHWGDATCWWSETRFDDLRPELLARGEFVGAWSRWFSDRGLSVVTAVGQPAVLQLDGVGALTLRVEFRVQAREVEIDLAEPTAADAVSRWIIDGWSGTLRLTAGTSYGLTITAVGSTLRIATAAADSPPLDAIEIRDSRADFTSWRITGLRHRRFAGAIGTQASHVLRVAPVPDAELVVGESYMDAPWPSPPVETPAIAWARPSASPGVRDAEGGMKVEPTVLPSALGGDGQVRAESSQVDVAVVPPPAPGGGRPEPAWPVRLHAAYAAAVGDEARIELLTIPLPLPGRVLHDLAFWPLDGGTQSVWGGPPLAQRGSVRHVDSRPERSGLVDMRRATVFLDGGGYLEAADVPGLDGIGTELHVQLWVMPQVGPAEHPTLVGNGRDASFWLGLIQGEPGGCLPAMVGFPRGRQREGAPAPGEFRLRLQLNGRLFESTGTIPQLAWSHVAFHYDGECVSFYVNGVLDVTHPAALGPVRANPERRLCIGSEPTPTEPFAAGFSGYLADLQIRRGAEVDLLPHHVLAAWPFDGDLRERTTGVAAEALGEARFDDDNPEDAGRRAARFDGYWCAVAPASRLADPGRRLCLSLRVKPDAGQSSAVLVGTWHWRLELRAAESGYRVVLWIGRQSVASMEVLPAGRWSQVIAGADGERATLYVNGRPQERSALRYGRVPRDPSGRVVIGAAAGSQGASLAAPFRGLIAELEAGDTLPGPPAPVLLVDRERSKLLADRLPTPPAPADPDPAGDLVARDLVPGTYTFLVQGVDLFGRVGEWSQSAPVVLESRSPPPAPGGARARFLPIVGTVSEVTAPTEAAPRWRVQVVPERTPVDAGVASRLGCHDIELARAVPAPEPPGGWAVERSATYEIGCARMAGKLLELELVSPPLPRLRPALGLRVIVAHDRWVRTEWSWTGTQRLLASQVMGFRLRERRWVPPEGAEEEPGQKGRWSTEWSALGGDPLTPVVHEDVFAMDEAAPPLECTGVLHAEWKRLRDAGVATLPEPEDAAAPPPSDSDPPRRRPRSRLWKVVLPVREPPRDDLHRRPPHLVSPDDFVAGALVAYNASPDVRGWQIFPVHWHEWSPAGGWTLYLVESSRGREPAVTAPPVLSQARYYPGQRYRRDAPLAAPPSFLDGAGRRVPTLAIEIAVRAVDASGRESPLEAREDERTGGAADVVAVDRRRPPRPPAPHVEISPADYYGQSKARVWWTLPDPATEAGAAFLGVGFQVYRATENAVFTRDLEQRRRSQEPEQRESGGHYGGLCPDEVVADNPDFEDWIRECFPGWVYDWCTRLFVARPLPVEPFTEGERDAWLQSREAWDAASEVWRAWTERFYPALRATARPGETHSEIQEIAERRGNESAFGQASAGVVAGTEYLDRVNGAVRNRYLYRLRSHSPALLHSTEYGSVGEPRAAPPTRPPATPALTRIEAGERHLTIRWTLNGEPDLHEYRLYRARTPKALEDLRWWRPAPDERIFNLPDPRLRATGNRVEFPEGLDVAGVVGVYRAEEYGGRALNYFSRAPAAPTEVVVVDGRIVGVRRLRALPDGTAVVVVYRTEAGEERTLGSLAEGGAYVDVDLLAGENHFYRIVAVDSFGNLSQGSTILQGRAFDTTPPRPPPLEAMYDDEMRQVRLSWEAEPGVEHMVQRYRHGELVWRQMAVWLTPGVGTWNDNSVEAGMRFSYRLRARSSTGVLNTAYLPRDVEVP